MIFSMPRQRRRRRRFRGPRRRRRLVKSEFVFYQRKLQLSASVQYDNESRNVLRVNMQWQRSAPNGNMKKKTAVDFAVQGNFTFLLARRRIYKDRSTTCTAIVWVDKTFIRRYSLYRRHRHRGLLKLLKKACPHGKCLTTKHHEKLFGNQTENFLFLRFW